MTRYISLKIFQSIFQSILIFFNQFLLPATTLSLFDLARNLKPRFLFLPESRREKVFCSGRRSAHAHMYIRTYILSLFATKQMYLGRAFCHVPIYGSTEFPTHVPLVFPFQNPSLPNRTSRAAYCYRLRKHAFSLFATCVCYLCTYENLHSDNELSAYY